MRRFLILIWLSFMALAVSANDSLVVNDTVVTIEKRGFLKRTVNTLYKFVRAFNTVDTNYIERQHYNYTVMLQSTNTYEQYTLSSKKGQTITLAPDMGYKIGPYFGWRWVFLGYSIDLKNINFSSRQSAKKEFDLSLYSSMIGIDLFYRRTGNDYKIRDVELGEGIDTDRLKNSSFGGINAGITGFNIYYIFNHKKFSYPAAYSQSTCQRRSTGSALLGIGYTRHSLEVDWSQLDELVQQRLSDQATEVKIDSSLIFKKVRYTDVSVSGGYTYNWVFARNWLFNASLSAGLGYKRSHADVEDRKHPFQDFSFRNFNLDGVGRFAIVWNNTRWYAGANTVLHSYNYQKDQFSTNNTFGSVNIYFGYNFGRQ